MDEERAYNILRLISTDIDKELDPFSGHARFQSTLFLEPKENQGTDMDIEVVKHLAKTGGTITTASVTLYLVVDNLFKEPVYNFLGSERTFILLLAIIAVALIAVIFSKREKSNQHNATPPKPGPTVNYRDSSTHNGDNRF